jgi:hypothetical protein
VDAFLRVLGSAVWRLSHNLTLTVLSRALQDVFYRPKEKQAQADQKKAKFFQVRRRGEEEPRGVFS